MMTYLLIKQHTMKAYWGSIGILHALTSALDGDERSASRPGCFSPRVKFSPYPLDRRLGDPQNSYGRGGREKNPIITPTGNQTQVVQLRLHRIGIMIHTWNNSLFL
jgi:hypothetical protein